jgi:hypothetical protein
MDGGIAALCSPPMAGSSQTWLSSMANKNATRKARTTLSGAKAQVPNTTLADDGYIMIWELVCEASMYDLIGVVSLSVPSVFTGLFWLRLHRPSSSTTNRAISP